MLRMSIEVWIPVGVGRDAGFEFKKGGIIS
jgi:hypothetical protein